MVCRSYIIMAILALGTSLLGKSEEDWDLQK